MCKNMGTSYFLKHSYERECCIEENNSSARVKITSFFFVRVFLSQVLQNYFRVFLLALSFEIRQDICRRPVNASFVELQSWYLI
jgi:hypothetical protein